MRDYSEKYLLIQREFPNRAGELLRIITTQKRLIQNLGHQKGDVGALMLASAEGHDVAIETLDWMKEVLQGVLKDAEALKEGSQVRNALAFQSSIVEEWLNRKP